MTSGSGTRVFRKLFTCEKKYNSVASRKALLKEFTSKVYNAKAVYGDAKGTTSTESYIFRCKLSENQEDETLTRITGLAAIFTGKSIEDLRVDVGPLVGVYDSANDRYEISVSGSKIEKKFNIESDSHKNINFITKKTDKTGQGIGSMTSPLLGDTESCLKNCKSNCAGTLDWTEFTDPTSYAICCTACISEC